MISYISGNVLHLDFTSVIILSEWWIWYEVFINERIFAVIWEQKEVGLFVYHQISENNQSLFWFASFEEREFFKELIKIPGVWGKVAQNILSLGYHALLDAVLSEDKGMLSSIKWVGKKMTEKILLELKDKDFIKNTSHTAHSQAHGSSMTQKNIIFSEVISTLVAMWYNGKKVEEVLQSMPSDLKQVSEIVPYVIKNI